jgi:aminoglycoside/choline kinase family phosphotransferase
MNAMNNNKMIGTFDVSGTYWCDIGTPPAYTRAIVHALKNNGETISINPSTEGCQDIEMNGFVVIEEGCVLEKNAYLKNCIILPHSTVRAGERHENRIIGKGFYIDFEEKEVLLESDGKTRPVGTGGSDRKFLREELNGVNVVRMQCSPHDPEFKRHIDYTKFFASCSVPVPKLIREDANNFYAIFEDLGDMSLYSWLRCERNTKDIEEIYRKALDIAIHIHSVVTQRVSECPALCERVFDRKQFLWESEYFLDRFARGIHKINVKIPSVLYDDLKRLAGFADDFRKTVIHRDFQSQNIMITGDKALYIIDYQGARIGPPAYDIASLLWDPYYHLNEDIRDRLLDYYIDKMDSTLNENFDRKEFLRSLPVCRLQRHMQALGAYGYLSSVKQKKYFLKFIPEAVRLLKEDIELFREEYPGLFILIKSLT